MPWTGWSRRAAAGRAELRALKEGRAWPNADDSAELVPIPDASRMRRDASRMRRDFEFRQISAFTFLTSDVRTKFGEFWLEDLFEKSDMKMENGNMG